MQNIYIYVCVYKYENNQQTLHILIHIICTSFNQNTIYKSLTNRSLIIQYICLSQ